MADHPEIWVGIDVGKSMHHACAIETDGKVVFSQKLGNDQRAIEQLITRAGGSGAAGAVGDRSDSAVSLESRW